MARFKTAIRLVSIALLAFAVTGCLGSESTEDGLQGSALSHPGAWSIPAATLDVGDSQTVEYTGAGPWVGESTCAGGITDGGATLSEFLQTSFPQIIQIGGYSCRHINGDPSTTSVHATGRALDIHIPLHAGDADNDLGDPIGNWLIEHAEEIGIQFIIWDRWTWGAHRPAGEKDRAYGGAHPHDDHLHIELSLEASTMGTPWFSGPMEPPAQTGCDVLPAEGGIVDDASECFRPFGAAEFWRSESAGYGDGLIWTNAFEGDRPSNWARWYLPVAEPGLYRVEVHTDAVHSIHKQVSYSLSHAGEETHLVVDPTGAGGWLEIGQFQFDPKNTEHLNVYDLATGPVAEGQSIVADAVRLTPAGSEPTTVNPPGPPGESVYAVPTPTWWGVSEEELERRRSPDFKGGCSAAPLSRSAPVWMLVGLLFLRRRRLG